MSGQQINLYHPIFRREVKLFSAATMARAWAMLVAVALLVYAFDAWQTYDFASALRNAVQDHTLATQRLASAYRVFGIAHARAERAALTKRVRTLRHLKRFLRESRRAKAGPAPVLEALSASVIPGLWVTHFSLDRGRKALLLAGHSERPALVPVFLARLVAGPTLSGYRFRHLTITRGRTHGRYLLYVNFVARTAASRKPAAAKGLHHGH